MYQPHLAFVQHRGFGALARGAAPELLKILRANGIVEGRVVDLGCGDGTWLRALTRAGFAATGIEQSAALVRYARRRTPEAAVRHASFYRAAIPRCEVVTALGEVLNYLPARNSRPPSLARFFKRAHAALRPGGLLIFDLLVSGRRMGYDTWREGRGWAVMVRVTEDPRNRLLTRHIVTFRRQGARTAREAETHVLRVPSRSSVLSELRRAGFIARSARRYGSFELPPRRVAFLGKKAVEPPDPALHLTRVRGSN